MVLRILDPITINISRVLEALFDELDYRSAKRAFRQAAKAKSTRRFPTRILRDEVMATSAKAISVRVA